LTKLFYARSLKTSKPSTTSLISSGLNARSGAQALEYAKVINDQAHFLTDAIGRIKADQQFGGDDNQLQWMLGISVAFDQIFLFLLVTI
jgi:hypothetical protein